MSRVKRGLIHAKKRRKLLASVKGYKWGRKSLMKQAKTASLHAGVHAYRDRRLKKRTARSLWQIKINAGARKNGTSYSQLIGAMKKANVALDRKVLADLAEFHPDVFARVVASVKK
ncbi:MAG: 50S ribosomal protein L20 [Candidatus Kerfeldbacteria bacterium]|nr:50S ribosomal protein L20 [Candidatus Kerfeldbacteria bacterium]